MNQLRVSHKSFFFQNKIYVIGGDYDMSCEVYDIRENKWSFISSYNSLLGNSLYSFSSAIAITGSEWSGKISRSDLIWSKDETATRKQTKWLKILKFASIFAGMSTDKSPLWILVGNRYQTHLSD